MENMIVSGGIAVVNDATPTFRSHRLRAVGALCGETSAKKGLTGRSFAETSSAPTFAPHLGLGSPRTP